MASLRRTLLLAFVLLVSVLPIAGAGAATGDAVLINEILVSTTSTDAEYLELYGTPGASLDGLSIIGVESDTGGSYGTIDFRHDFGPTDAIGVNGFYLMGNGVTASTYGVTPNVPIADNSFENSSATYALVETSSLAGGSVTGSEEILDSVFITDSATDVPLFGAPTVGPDGTFLPAGAGRIVDGVDTDGAVDWKILDFGNDASVNTPTAGEVASVFEIVINEVLASTAGTDSEYVEFYGTAGASLAGLSFIVVESDEQSSNGAIDFRYDFGEGAVLGDNGFLLLANATAAGEYGLTPNITIDGNSFENSSSTYGLVETSSLSGDSVTGAEAVVDAVGSTDGEVDSFFHLGAPVVGPDGSFFPAGLGRIVDGVDTDTVDDWEILSFSNDKETNTPTVGTGVEPPPPPGPLEVKIHEIQGTGGNSPLVGERVVVEGVVVSDEETFDRLAGFFVQEEDADADADPMTSEGIFVFNHAGDDVSVGDVVRVEGTVEERFGNTQLTDFVDITVLGTGSTAASAATLTFPLTSLDDLEAYEGMLVKFSHEMVVTEFFNFDRYGTIVMGKPSAGADRPMNPTAVYPPGSSEGIELASDNLLSRITIDDYSSSQNPDFVLHPLYRNEFTLANYFRGGDSVMGLTGAIYYSFDEHKLYPTGWDSLTENPRQSSAPDVGGDLTVATLNTLNYFLTLDDGPDICGPMLDQECRGADDAGEFERQRAKLLSALLALDADVVGLVELENTFGVSPEADLVAGLNAALGAEVYGYIDAGVVGTDTIRNGFIYKVESVQQVGEIAILDTPEFLDPMNTGDDKNRAALAVTFKETNGSQRFTAVVNHFKSKGSSCGEGDDSPYAGSCNLTRTMAAEELVGWIGMNPTEQKDTDWMIIGDLNSYDMEDPIVALESLGFEDLIETYEGSNAFSYVFDGQWGYLDYAMATASMADQVVDAAVWNLNSEEADIFDYDTTWKSDTQDALFEGDKPYRSSDHDAVLVGVTLTGKRGQTKQSPPK